MKISLLSIKDKYDLRNRKNSNILQQDKKHNLNYGICETFSYNAKQVSKSTLTIVIAKCLTKEEGNFGNDFPILILGKMIKTSFLW